MTDKLTKDEELALTQEIHSAVHLVEFGLFIVYGWRNVEHVQLAVLSSGLERMLKLVIVLDFFAANGRLPNLAEYNKTLECKTHDLRLLLKKVVEIAEKKEGQKVRAEALQDLPFLKSPTGVLDDVLDIFSEYAQQGRYHDLNILVGAGRSESNPAMKLECLLDSTLTERIIEVVQRFTRSLCWIMQGKMSDRLADNMNQILGDFLYIEDADLSKLAFDWRPDEQNDELS